MAKYEHGEYINLYWDDFEKPYEVVKGHVCDGEFISRVEAELGHDCPQFSSIEQKYGRWGMGFLDGEPTQKFYDYNERGRGRFPVTIGFIEAKEYSNE